MKHEAAAWPVPQQCLPSSIPLPNTSTTMGRADSATLKARKAQEDADLRMNLAVQAYMHERSKPSGGCGLRDVALQYQVSHVTLSRQYKGAISMSEFNASKQKLTTAEEQTIVNYVLESADRGLPLTHSALTSLANKLLE